MTRTPKHPAQHNVSVTSSAGLTTIRIDGPLGQPGLHHFAHILHDALTTPGVKFLTIDVFAATLTEPDLAQALAGAQHDAAAQGCGFSISHPQGIFSTITDVPELHPPE